MSFELSNFTKEKNVKSIQDELNKEKVKLSNINSQNKDKDFSFPMSDLEQYIEYVIYTNQIYDNRIDNYSNIDVKYYLATRENNDSVTNKQKYNNIEICLEHYKDTIMNKKLFGDYRDSLLCLQFVYNEDSQIEENNSNNSKYIIVLPFNSIPIKSVIINSKCIYNPGKLITREEKHIENLLIRKKLKKYVFELLNSVTQNDKFNNFIIQKNKNKEQVFLNLIVNKYNKEGNKIDDKIGARVHFTIDEDGNIEKMDDRMNNFINQLMYNNSIDSINGESRVNYLISLSCTVEYCYHQDNINIVPESSSASQNDEYDKSEHDNQKHDVSNSDYNVQDYKNDKSDPQSEIIECDIPLPIANYPFVVIKDINTNDLKPNQCVKHCC